MAITALTDWDYYDGTFRTAMGSVTIPQTDFLRYAIKASNMIRKYTFGNIDESEEIIDDVQFCVCEIAEYIFKCDARDDGNDGVSSEKDGSWSATYESTESRQKTDDKAIKNIIYNYLAFTGLLYCGV